MNFNNIGGRIFQHINFMHYEFDIFNRFMSSRKKISKIEHGLHLTFLRKWMFWGIHNSCNNSRKLKLLDNTNIILTFLDSKKMEIVLLFNVALHVRRLNVTTLHIQL